MKRPRTELQNFLHDMGGLVIGYTVAGFCIGFGLWAFWLVLGLFGGLL